jgi:hypothetical protein
MGVYGVLANNVFCFGGTSGPAGTRYSLMTINPFLNYNFPGGWFVGTVPIMTVNWMEGGEKWTLPVGLQGGRLIKIADKPPVNMLVDATTMRYVHNLAPPGSVARRSPPSSSRVKTRGATL